MRTDTQKYAAAIAPQLQPGEQLLVAARVEYRGGAKTHTAVRLLERAVEGAASGPPALGTVAASVPLRRSLWVLTDRRTLFFKLGAFGPGPLNGAIANDSVRQIAAAKAKTMFGKLELRFGDGSAVVLDLLADKEVDRINDAGRQLTGA